jgi:ribonuclease HII
MSLKSSAKVLKANRRVSRRTFDARFGVPVCGIDEAGRGPLAGPVVTACVFIPAEHAKHPVWRDVADSKQLLPQKREYLYELIIQRCIYHIAEASVEEIDTLNIHHATLLAMTRAYDGVHDRIENSRRSCVARPRPLSRVTIFPFPSARHQSSPK